MMKISAFILLFFSGVGFLHAQDSTQQIVPGRVNRPNQMGKPYVILISADGFRYDLADKYHAKNLLQLRKQGVNADYMQSSFPSLTFPNHYTIVTGLYPAHHGLVDNSFYDPAKQASYSIGNKSAVQDSSWYGGTPLWVLAEKHGMLSACFYWVGSEAAIQGVRPTYYYNFNERIPMNSRIRIVRDWLSLPEEKRPHLITFYIPDVDHQEHLHGVDSRETEMAVQYVDESIGKLVRTVDSLQLPVDFIFLSDHGMLNIDTLNYIGIPPVLDTNQFRIVNSLSLVHLYAYNQEDILSTEIALKSQASDYDVYLADELPAIWHYSKADDVYNRIGDILLVSRPPKVFNFKKHHLNLGEHGFDPSLTEMHACFYAWGPDFKKHYQIPGFENIHVFPLIARILKLPYSDPIDGRLRVLKGTLR
ncbi:MAG: ectonucleotide pyrophosphatase/phosphodiesterase [Bacteroidota bacterium]|nr:ectonucleotide pyrophosphatase/phosphodiesterase [Bacteroidota bacterium]MDP4250326.1 ectonucleotide pyrophosphatase/phosphodiesterase [Bacteroidota bacterium]